MEQFTKNYSAKLDGFRVQSIVQAPSPPISVPSLCRPLPFHTLLSISLCIRTWSNFQEATYFSLFGASASTLCLLLEHHS